MNKRKASDNVFFKKMDSVILCKNRRDVTEQRNAFHQEEWLKVSSKFWRIFKLDHEEKLRLDKAGYLCQSIKDVSKLKCARGI